MVERTILSNPQPLALAQSPQALLGAHFLQQRLQASSERVRMWAAYQLASRWEGEWPSFVPTLWDAQQEELRELAINLTGTLRLKHYVFPLLQVFRKGGESNQRHLAALALGRLGDSTAKPLLWRWFGQLLEDDDTDVNVLGCALESLLLLDAETVLPKMLRYLPLWQQSHTHFNAMFGALCSHVHSAQHAKTLAQAYGRVRGVFHDAELVGMLFSPHVPVHTANHVKAGLGAGLSLAALYREALEMLGCFAALEHLGPVLDALPQRVESQADLGALLTQIPPLLEVLMPQQSHNPQVEALLNASHAWVERWEEGILKVRQHEALLLVALPVSLYVTWLEQQTQKSQSVDPKTLSYLYNSPFSSVRFVCNLLIKVAASNSIITADSTREGTPPNASMVMSTNKEATREPASPFLAQPSAQPNTPAQHAPPQKAQAPLQSLTEEEKTALWRLYTNQLEIDENISQQLSQPWDIPLPSLLPRLGSLLRKKLPHDVMEGRTAEVEYALEVLRREGHPASIHLALNWFAALLSQCYDAFLDFMTHLPDARFLPLLQDYYRRGESDVLQLMRFIADVHGLPYPTLDVPNPTHLGKLRLTCNACQAPYHYAYHRLYVNAECLEQRQPLQEKDVWTDQNFWCKRCGGQIPIALEEPFLRAILNELLLLRFSPNEATPLVSGRLELLAFPRFEGRVCNPAIFLPIAQQFLPSAQASTTPPHPWKTTRNEVLLELGKLRLAFKEPRLACQAFQHISQASPQWPYAQLHLGMLAFQQGHMPRAREHFVHITDNHTADAFADDVQNPVEMAEDYLQMLNKQTYKRSHLRVLPSASPS